MMPSNLMVLLLGCSFILSCKSDESRFVDAVDQNLSSFSDTLTLAAINIQWLNNINENSDSLINLYHNESIIIDETGVIDWNNYISKWRDSDIKSIVSLGEIDANANGEYIYQIVRIELKEGKEYQNLIIWHLVDGQWRRQLEFVGNSSEPKGDLSLIDQRRSEWMEKCNDHNVAGLVEGLYAPNAIYYNHKPAVLGRVAIKEEYQYMSSEDYQLSLSPNILVEVNNTLVYEIGQCQGSYKGKYILIWQKNASDIWEVFMDSNI